MKRTRILLGRLPPILADLVRQLLGDEAETWIATSVDDDEDILAAAAETRADVVVIAMGDEVRPAAISRTLNERYPGVALVLLDARGRAAERYVAGRLECATHDLSPRTLRELVRPGA